mmetsp:Transcript_16481/g.51582  ORF Transcript_16481/g.51582 Transcript_16481/m.51582 type:complete len:201 (-) Transcript_16481:270-872(-)
MSSAATSRVARSAIRTGRPATRSCSCYRCSGCSTRSTATGTVPRPTPGPPSRDGALTNCTRRRSSGRGPRTTSRRGHCLVISSRPAWPRATRRRQGSRRAGAARRAAPRRRRRRLPPPGWSRCTCIRRQFALFLGTTTARSGQRPRRRRSRARHGRSRRRSRRRALRRWFVRPFLCATFVQRRCSDHDAAITMQLAVEQQ